MLEALTLLSKGVTGCEQGQLGMTHHDAGVYKECQALECRLCFRLGQVGEACLSCVAAAAIRSVSQGESGHGRELLCATVHLGTGGGRVRNCTVWESSMHSVSMSCSQVQVGLPTMREL